jgi:hypothetical protein
MCYCLLLPVCAAAAGKQGSSCWAFLPPRIPLPTIRLSPVQDGEGNVVGEVQQRWHLWRRNYDLYIGEAVFNTSSEQR